jgi:hypothetical protein
MYSHNLLRWVKTSAGDVPTHIDGDEKDGITVPAKASANGIKWSLYFLAPAKRGPV